MPPSFAPILLEAHNPGPMTGHGNNTFVVAGPDGANREAVLIDAGVGHAVHLDAIDAALAELGARLTYVVVTHGHADHASGAAALAARHPESTFLKYPWPDVDVRYAAPWTRVDEGDRIAIGGDALTVMCTPGHSPDHIVLWHEASRSLFCGDLVIPGGSVMIDTAGGGSLEAYLKSLERVIALDPLRMFPAHGNATDNPVAVLRAAIQHRRRREQQVLEGLAAGHDTVAGLTDAIYGRLAARLTKAAQQNVRAHLLKLRQEGRADDTDDRWSIRLAAPRDPREH